MEKLMTGETRVEFLTRLQQLPPAAVLECLEESRATLDAIQGETRYTKEARAELFREARAHAERTLGAALEAIEAEAATEIDRAIDAIEDELRNDPPLAKMGDRERQYTDAIVGQLHAQRTAVQVLTGVQVVGLTDDAADLERLFDEAETAGYEPVMAAAAARAEARARVARRAPRGGHEIGERPETVIAFALRQRLTAYRQAHPTARERKHTLEAQRDQRLLALRQSATIWRRVYGL